MKELPFYIMDELVNLAFSGQTIPNKSLLVHSVHMHQLVIEIFSGFTSRPIEYLNMGHYFHMS